MRLLVRLSLSLGYLAVVLLPLWLALDADRPEGVDPAYEVSLATGLVALSLLVVTFVLPKRMRALSRALGIDVVLGVHRLVGMAALAFVLAHLVSVLVADPDNVALLDVVDAPNRARAAVGATVALGLLVTTSVWRKRLLRRYEHWRAVHVVLAMSVLVLTGLHVWWLRHLIVQSPFRVWFALLGAVVLAVSLRRWVWRPLRAWRRPYRVAEVRRESPTVSTVRLKPIGHPGMRRFKPGQFAWIRIGSTPLGFEEHPFTIASAPLRSGSVEFTVKELGDFSTSVGDVEVGDRVWVDGPHGAFTPDHLGPGGLVLIAGGVGITPMMSMLRSLAQRGDDRELTLFTTANDLGELLFRDEIAALSQRLRLHVVELLAQPHEGWTGGSGFLTADVLADNLPERRERLDYFLCGPPPMVAAVTGALRSLGIGTSRIHTEKFDFV